MTMTPPVRTGLGYDVHRLVAGEELWLGGIRIEHDKGLSGHSDADVALHALTDALLGAIGDGDIGSHFPPSDPQWKGADSQDLLRRTVARLAQRTGARAALVAGRVDGAADTHAFAAALSLAEIAGDPAAALASPERYLEAAGSVLASRLAEPA